MKHLLYLTGTLWLLSMVPSANAQTTWWGMTAGGGTSNIGTIYSITEAGVYTKHHDFFRFEGGSPKGEAIKGADGNYYGVTEFGGTDGVGVLFRYNPTTAAYTVLFNFTTSTSGAGARPTRAPIQASNGRLYGTCTQGGLNNLGTLWEYNLSTSTMTKRRDFDNATGSTRSGSTPRGRLVQASNGIIYGTTQLGGLNNGGTIFSLNGTTFTRLYDFPALPPGTTGSRPTNGLIQPVAGGLLYGMTGSGGVNGGGVIFSFNITGSVVTSVYDFATATGRTPLAELVRGPDGKLYGSTSTGGLNNAGTLFRYEAGTDTFESLYDLGGASGSSPFGRLSFGSDGLLYGTASSGGSVPGGTLYRYNTTTDAFEVIYNFGSGGYGEPWGAALEDPNGTFVCMTNTGGSGGNGALMKFTPATNTSVELVAFGFSNGATPKGRLLKASNGLFYGVTSSGGTSNAGILFSFDPNSSAFTRIASFNSTLGTFPQGALVEVSGKLYGVCSQGGASDGGTLFEYTIGTNTLVKKVDLVTTVGSSPQAGLFKAGNGRLYGTTTAGALNGFGSIFDYVPATNTLTKRYDLNTTSGTSPFADPMQASNGLLYGTCTANGQFNNGTLWSFDTGTNTFTRLWSFDGLQGGAPAGELVQAGNGRLYGTYRDEGQGFTGGIFSWDIGTSTYTDEYGFNVAPITDEGKFSESNLILGTDGLLYGTTPQGGTSDLGTIFRFNTATQALGILQNLTGSASGQFAFDGLATDVVPGPSAVQLSAKLFLEGPFISATQRMNAALRSLVGVNGFPTTEPFTAAGFTIVGGGGETINPAVLATTGDNAVVDWLLLELRNKNNSANVLRTKAVLLQSDGDIVDLDNASPVSFSMPADNYFVAFRSRNHLGVMTASAVALSGTPLALDMTTGAVATFGTNAQKVIGSTRVCWAGNVARAAQNQLQYIGAGNDRDPILVRVGSTTPNGVAAGYYFEDVTMDGIVSYVGAGNDRDPILVNVGGTTPNNVLVEQLP